MPLDTQLRHETVQEASSTPAQQSQQQRPWRWRYNERQTIQDFGSIHNVFVPCKRHMREANCRIRTKYRLRTDTTARRWAMSRGEGYSVRNDGGGHRPRQHAQKTGRQPTHKWHWPPCIVHASRCAAGTKHGKEGGSWEGEHPGVAGTPRTRARERADWRQRRTAESL